LDTTVVGTSRPDARGASYTTSTDVTAREADRCRAALRGGGANRGGLRRPAGSTRSTFALR